MLTEGYITVLRCLPRRRTHRVAGGFLPRWWLTRQRWAASGEVYPKPSISVSPSVVVPLRGNCTILCKGQKLPQVEFFLAKFESGRIEPFGVVPSETDEVSFPVAANTHAIAGTYKCLVRSRIYPLQQFSPYSDPVKIYVREQEHRKPSISVSSEAVPVGGNLKISCRNEEHRHAEFSLIKEGAPDVLQTLRTDMDEAIFPITAAKESDGGIYWCDYWFPQSQDHRCSYFSDKVHIHLTDPHLRKPSMQLQPKGQLALGAKVTIRCQGPEKALRFSLLKSKQIKASQMAGPDSSMATFRIFMDTLKDAGGYTCRYHHKEHPFVWSNQSNPVELILRDPGLPRPSIQVRPSGQPAVSMNVTFECQGPEKGLHFTLLKSREQKASQWAEEDRRTAEFPLSLMSQEDAGTYACQYHRKGKRFVWSEPSDPVELRLRGDPPNMTIVWACVVAGVLLLLLLLAFALHRKMKRGSTSKESSQSVSLPLEPEAAPEEVSYAVLAPSSFKVKQATLPKEVPDSCVYASVVKSSTRDGQ